MADPLAFVEYDAVFGPEVHGSARFRAAFSGAYRRIAADGPVSAMERLREPAGEPLG